MREYPVDPTQVATVLAQHVRFESGWLDGSVVLIEQVGQQRTLVVYRPAQVSGVWLEGSDAPLRLPLPPLLLVRQTDGNGAGHYRVFAVTQRPTDWDTPLFHAPLPNIYSSGAVCWGNVRVEPTLPPAQVWQPLLGSPFGNHAVWGKSRRFPTDIRQHWLDLAQARRRVYPLRDLMPTSLTLRHVVRGEDGDHA